MRVAMKLTDMASVDILKVLLSLEPKSPMDLAQEIDKEPQTVRNALVHLKSTGLVKRVGYGKYTITDLGREVLKRYSQPSNVQGSKESE